MDKQLRALENALDDLEGAKAYLIRAKAKDATLEAVREAQRKVQMEIGLLRLSIHQARASA